MIYALFCVNVSPKKELKIKIFPGVLRDSEKESTPKPALGMGALGSP